MSFSKRCFHNCGATPLCLSTGTDTYSFNSKTLGLCWREISQNQSTETDLDHMTFKNSSCLGNRTMMNYPVSTKYSVHVLCRARCLLEALSFVDNSKWNFFFLLLWHLNDIEAFYFPAFKCLNSSGKLIKKMSQNLAISFQQNIYCDQTLALHLNCHTRKKSGLLWYSVS